MSRATKHPSGTRLHKHLFKAFIIVGIFCSFVILGVFIGMNYYGEFFIKRYLQKKIQKTSHGIYKIDFDKFSFNLFSGKSTITNFNLIPNEERYEKLREEGKVKSTLYSISYEKLTLNKLYLKEIYFEKIIHLRMIEMDKPTISFIAFPDSTTRKRGRFQRIYKDIYPVFSSLFTVVKIDSILVNEGSFSAKQTLKSGQTMEGDWLYSAVLRDFDISAFQYYDTTRIFYSKDIELRIKNFYYALADSLYFLNADEVGFSLIGSRLFGKEITLTPNFARKNLAKAKAGNFYQVYLPYFSINGVNLYKALLEKEILINSIDIENLDVKMFMHKPPDQAVKKRRSTKAKVTVANIYTILENKLRNVVIDTFSLRNASFQFYPRIDESKPELNVDRATINLYGFRLDSLAHLDTTKILYSRDIELNLRGFTLALQDKLHDLSAQEVHISTRKNSIDVKNTMLIPSVKVDSSLSYKSNSYYQMMFPEVRFDQIDIRRMFNTRKLDFARLAILEPDMSIIQFRQKKAKPDTSVEKESFIGKLNLIRHLVTPYMISLHAETIEISNARISFRHDRQRLNEQRIYGLVDLTLTGVEYDTLTLKDRNAFLNRLELELKLLDFRYVSPDSLHRITIGELYANSLSAQLDIKNFSMFTTSRTQPGVTYPSWMRIKFKSLDVNGYDHRKWINEKWFSARNILLHEPTVVIRSVRKKRESTLAEPFADFEENIKKIEVGDLKIEKGWFDLVEEDEKTRGSLLVRNFDFQLSKYLFDLTGWNEGRKIFRYDLLSLRPDTAKPIIFDSSYTISFSRFLSDSYPPGIMIKDLHIKPMKPEPGMSEKTLAMEVSLPSFILKGLELEKALFDRDLIIQDILIREPEITLVHKPDLNPRKPTGKKTLSSHPELKIPFNSVDLGIMELTDGTVNYSSHKSDSSTHFALDRISTKISGFRYDSTLAGKDASTIFYCRDIELNTGKYSVTTKDSMNTISLGGLYLSTGKSELVIDSFALIPNYSDFEYSRKLGYQTDRMDVQVNRIALERLDFKTFLEQRKVRAGIVEVKGMVMDNFRDKRVAFPTWDRPPMIQQAIRKITFPISIDTLSLKNGKVTYREQTEDEPGMIFFDRMDMLARNFTTDSIKIAQGAELVVNGSTYLMGKAHVAGQFRFPLQSPSDTFFFYGRAGQVDMTIFNPMISKVAPVRIKSGIVDSLNLQWMTGNQTYATGLLDLYYQGLQVELLHVKKGFWHVATTDLLQVLVNMAVPQENPGYFGHHRRGYIWNERDNEKGYFNFFWKSILAGLKSSEGLNSKEQKAFKKELKRELKSYKKTR